MDAVIPVYQRIEQDFPNGDHGIQRPVCAPTRHRVDDGRNRDIAGNKGHRLFQHLGKRPLDPRVIGKSLAEFADFAKL